MSTQQPEALEAAEQQHMQELRSYRITVENREARIAELEAEIERLRKLHQDAYQRGFQAGSRGLREAHDAAQEIKRQDAWGNAHLTKALIAAEYRAERAEARITELEARVQELEAQLVKEAARTAEQKLRADQLEQQHAMQAKMHAQAAEQLAAAQQGAALLPDGWKLVAVNPEFDNLMYWLDRCGEKGHLSSDLIEPWIAFDYDSKTNYSATHPTTQGMDALIKALEDLERACDKRASLTTTDVYNVLIELPGMSAALLEMDVARAQARAALAALAKQGGAA